MRGAFTLIFSLLLAGYCVNFYINNKPTRLVNVPFACPSPKSLYWLSLWPYYHKFNVYFLDSIDPNKTYYFFFTRLNFEGNNKWECFYYDNANDPTIVTIDDDNKLNPVGDEWVGYNDEYSCRDDDSHHCLVQNYNY